MIPDMQNGPMSDLRRGPPAGWRMASVASGFLVLSLVAGAVSLLAGFILLLPLAVLALPFLLRRFGGGGNRGRNFPWRFPGLRRV